MWRRNSRGREQWRAIVKRPRFIKDRSSSSSRGRGRRRRRRRRKRRRHKEKKEKRSFHISNSTEQISSRETHIRPTSKEISHILWYQK
jgi:hypothetical protein